MKEYSKPVIHTEKVFETSALSCAKSMGYPNTGSHHFSSAYDTFTGHLGPGMGMSSTMSPGQIGVGYGPGGTSQSYPIDGLCSNWVGLAS